MAQKFNFKKIHQYVNKQQSKFNLLKSFFKNIVQHERKNRQSLEMFQKDIEQATHSIKNKNINKMVSNFTIHSLEFQQASEMIKTVGNKIGFWLEELTEQYRDIKQKLRNMERKKDSLTAQEIEAYKQELTTDMIAVTEKNDSVVQLYCYSIIKNNSQQVEKLTSCMQNQKTRASQVQKK